MTTKLEIQESSNGLNAMIVHGAEYVDTVLANDTVPHQYTVPAGYAAILFSGNKDFYIRWDGGAASIPTGNITDGTGSELNPTARAVVTGQTISIIGSAVDTIVSLAVYKLK